MNIFKNLFPKNLYHSYVISCNLAKASDYLIEFLQEEGHIINRDINILSQEYASFTISDSKLIKDWANLKKTNDYKKICIISTKFMNTEAQQSLLKIIEEPKDDTYFFIIMPNVLNLLDTILSRAQVIEVSGDNVNDSLLGFVDLSISKRLDFIENLIKNHEGEDTSGPLRHEATMLINQIEKDYYAHFKNSYKGKDKNKEFIFEELQKSRLYLSTPGASVKMILENLALVL